MARRTTTEETTVERTGVTPTLIALGVLGVLFIVFLGQNTGDVPVEFLWFDGSPPLFMVLLATMVASFLAAMAVAGVWRRRRRRSRSERAELERLRSGS